MSTQHIEEADELADRVCIMSHGTIIGLDTPEAIKRKFGVGYNLFVEPRHDIEEDLSDDAVQALFEKVRAIFLGMHGEGE